MMLKKGDLVKFHHDSPLRGFFGNENSAFKVMYAEDEIVCINTIDPDTLRGQYRELPANNFLKVV